MSTFKTSELIPTLESSDINELEMFVNKNGIYWAAEPDNYIFIERPVGHRFDDYIDESHEQIVNDDAGEGVNVDGTFWKNGDFDSPYDVADIKKAIQSY